VAGLLLAQTPERRAALERVRRVVRQHLPQGYVERVAAGLIVYEVPLSVYPDTYNGHPLWYVALGAHKSYLSLYMMMAYASPEATKRLQDGFTQAGKKLNMGKSCINFETADDLALDVIGELVASVPLERWVAIAKSAQSGKKK
jgi:hypothetical protein